MASQVEPLLLKHYSRLQRKSWGQYASAAFGTLNSLSDNTTEPTATSSFDPMATSTNKRKRTSLEQDSSRAAPAENSELTQYEDGSALSQLIAHNEAGHMNGGGGANQSATDTAAAALSYSHGLPDLSFSQQSTGDNDGSFQGGTGFSLDALKDSSGAVTQTSPTAPSSASKPPVGSDAWHKVRRDNHKEGTFVSYFAHFVYSSLTM